MRRPSRRVLANRRRLALWLPLTVVGGLTYFKGLHIDDLYLSLIGMVAVMTGFPGVLMDNGREIYAYPYWEEDLK